jgi:hypothetical protein
MLLQFMIYAAFFLRLILGLPIALVYTFFICTKAKNETTYPYCKEVILKKAIIYKHCKQEITGE